MSRVSNSIYDVTQFEMIVVLDTQYVKPFVQLLQQGKFLHVLEMDLQNVDLAEALDEGYDYGNRPVVEVRLKCEALFLREWTVMTTDSKSKPGLMPAPVQKELGIGAAVAVPPADAATPTP